MLNSVLRWISFGLAIVALAAGVSLLVSDARLWSPPGISAAAISAAPLLLIGVAFLFLQPVIRPRRAELAKNILLAGTFLLWGIIQLMPQNYLAERLGSLVIVLYVVDLAWTNFASMKSREQS
jgi:peptidoglycan/LPS O-acetylase OafA/YrhL